MSPRYVIIGAVAIGGALAGSMVATGIEVALIARCRSLALLQERGLTLGVCGMRSRIDMPTYESPSDVELDVSDIVLLTVKSQDAQAVYQSSLGDVAVGCFRSAPMPAPRNGPATSPQRISTRAVTPTS
jgi:ketopantoate reductase